VFDASGHVVGVTVAECARRGRVITADARSVQAALAGARVSPGAESAAAVPRIGGSDWERAGAALRRSLTVAKVVCLVE
jgi:hypothetical protein